MNILTNVVKFLNLQDFLSNETWLNKPHLLVIHFPFSVITQRSLLACVSLLHFSATQFMFSLVCPASCVTPSEGLNCSESIDIVKMIESNTVIGFWENLIEDVKKYFFYILIYEAWI